jgi:hypothetical protein
MLSLIRQASFEGEENKKVVCCPHTASADDGDTDLLDLSQLSKSIMRHVSSGV